MKKIICSRLLVCAALLALAPTAQSEGLVCASTFDVLEGQLVEAAFSPDGGADDLVRKVINSAGTSIRLAGYSFTSPGVVRALTNAKRRGVDVAVVVDYKSNVGEPRNNAPRRALNLMVKAGIPIRTVDAYAIHHDKFVVVDGRHVQTGSFNYTMAAAKRNSENVLVVWNDLALAKQYIAHWQSRWTQGRPYELN